MRAPVVPSMGAATVFDMVGWAGECGRTHGKGARMVTRGWNVNTGGGEHGNGNSHI